MDESELEVETRISADLVQRIGRGERNAEEEMVRRYGPGLLYLLKRRTGDPQLALDIRQETLRIAIEKLRASALNQPERMAAYLRAVALNLLIAQARKRARHGTTADSDAVEAFADPGQGPYDHVSADQQRRAVERMLAELPVARDREILVRTYLKDESKAAICADLGIDATHFNRVLFRAKQRFRELLERAGPRGKLRAVDS